MSDELEQQLAELGRHITFPPTPQLTAMVRIRLHQPAPRPIITRWRAILAAVFVVLALVFGVPPVRTAIAHWLGIQGIVIKPVTSLPATPTPHPPASSAAVGTRLNLGQATSLAHARSAVGFPLAVPGLLGPPDAVFTRNDLGPVASLVYAPRAGFPESGETGVGLLITEFRGATNPMLMEKFVGPGTTILPVGVAGGAGFWISGVHEIAYQLPDGSFAPDTLRLAGPTLVFARGDIAVRIEGALSEATALSIAETLM